jgi:hypothetical protein
MSLVALSLPVVGRAESEPPGPTPTIRAGDLAELLTLIKPHPGEAKWAEIPWLTSLSQARQQAAAVGKPILLWEMDGNPLGCT